MCGFIFKYCEKQNSSELCNVAGKALMRLRHRGPDDEGLWCTPPSIMGHRRLSVIDLENSRQPMQDSGQRFVLAYNGEIYNYKELRNTLIDSWEFITDGDTEVVLAGLIIYGESFLGKMEGMWSLGLWDQQNKLLLLSRDRMGKKPLYYQVNREGFACASELPALADLSLTSWQEDINSTADYLRYGYYLPGTTAYKEVHEVLPGHVLKWDQQTGIKQKSYWSLNIGGFTGSRTQAGTILREKFIRAVERRLVADVEVGAFLSGGIDSSLIVSVLSNELDTNIKTFTIGFDEASYDERKYANLIAKSCGTEHFEQCFGEWEWEKLISLIMQNVGQPFADSSLLPTAMVSELASSRVKVVLSGDGGDELFSGYQRYQARVLLQWYTRLPDVIKKNVARLVRAIPEPMSHHSHSLLKKAHLFIDIVNRHQTETPYIAPVLYSCEDFQRLAPELINKGHKPQLLPAETSEDCLLEMMCSDALIYLPQDIMAKVDRASMAFSLETRAPFLDREIVELAFSLPVQWHRSGYRGKRMLQAAFPNLLPDIIYQRRKQGFGVPVHKWFRGRLGIVMLELLNQLKTPLDSAYIMSLLQVHRNGKRDHGYRLWNIFIYLLWLHKQPWLRS